MKIASISFGYPDAKNRVKLIFTHEQACALQSLGAQVDVFDLSADCSIFPSIQKTVFENISVYRFPMVSIKRNMRTFLEYRDTIRRIVSENQYDLVIFSFINVSYLAYLSAFKVANSTLAVTTHGVDAMGLWETPLIKILKKRFLDKMDWIFPVSDYTAHLVETMINPSLYSKIKINYNGIKREKLNKVLRTNIESLKRKLDIRQRWVFLTVCDLIPRKGVDINIKADKILRDQNIDFLHVIIGRGSEKEKLIAMTEQYELEDNVQFIDYIDSDETLMEYYAICDIYTMISKTIYNPLGVEGFGISYIEAEYLGKPVVGGNSGGVSTAVKHGFTGYLVDPNDARVEHEVAGYIKKLYDNSELYARISQNAKQYVEDNFDWEKNAGLILSQVGFINEKS